MSRIKLFISFAFVLAMFAGVAVGMLSARLPASREPRSWLADELNLSPEQREQMRAIWQDVSKNRQADWERRRAIEKERADAIVALLNESQKAAYEKIVQESQQKSQEISKQREQAMTDAQERTRQMLNAEQRVKYEQLMQKRREDKASRGERRRGEPATEPSARGS